MRPRLIAGAAVLVLAGGLAACGEDSGAGAGHDPPDPTTGETADPPSRFEPDASACLDPRYPLPLTVETSVDAERPYIENVVACTGDEQYGPLWLRNVGEEVWNMPDDLEIEWLENSDESFVFAEAFDSPAFLVPGDQVVVHAVPTAVSWDLDIEYTVAWEAFGEGVTQLESYGTDVLTTALTTKGSGRAALAACAITGFNVADEWAGDPDGFSENFGATLSTGAGVASCASKWEQTWARKFKPSATFL
jgi:hypothetical protein